MKGHFNAAASLFIVLVRLSTPCSAYTSSPDSECKYRTFRVLQKSSARRFLLGFSGGGIITSVNAGRQVSDAFALVFFAFVKFRYRLLFNHLTQTRRSDLVANYDCTSSPLQVSVILVRSSSNCNVFAMSFDRRVGNTNSRLRKEGDLYLKLYLKNQKQDKRHLVLIVTHTICFLRTALKR